MRETRSGTHTPGPWTFEEIGESAARDLRLQTPAFWIVGDHGMSDEVVATVEQVTVERALADARLIAAAPDLYDAMTGAMDYLEGTLAPCEDGCECLLHSFRAAIAKAEGRS